MRSHLGCSTRHQFCLEALQSLPALVILVLLMVSLGDGRPEGSPFSACQSMLPAHGGRSARADLSPYVVLVSQASYNPGDTVSVMLRGLCNIEFMGFLAQARRADPDDPRMRRDPYEAIGSFSAVMGTRYECGGDRVALTQSDRYSGTTLLFNWTAPATPQGHIQIMASFVQRFDSFWPMVASVVVADPRAAPLSVDPNDLRTPFITPCEIDRPTTPTPPGVGTTPSTIPATTSDMLATTRGQLTPPLFVTTPPELIDLSGQDFPLCKDPRCGTERGCFLGTRGGSCDFDVMWREEGDALLFDVRANQKTSSAEEYVAVAFSKDTKMGSDSVVECTDSDIGNKVHISYNGRFKNEPMKELDTTVLPMQRMRTVDGIIHCQFARKKSQRGEERVFDLENDYYVFVAQGNANDGRKAEHSGLPAVSETLVDFQKKYMVVTPLLIDRIFIKTHACVMVFAWLFCASIGIVVARFYKPLWPHKTLCKRKVWFTIHRTCMMTAGICNIIGFIIIFYEVQGMADVSIQRFQKLHPVIGIATTFLVIVQILLGIFRPHSSSEKRIVFNWGHWLLGIVSHILTVFNMMLGMGLKKAGVHPSVMYVLYAFCVYQILVVVVLEVIFCNIRIKVRKQQSYSVYEIRNAIYSSTKDILDATVSEPPGSFLLRVLLFLHILIITSFTAGVVFVIAFIDYYCPEKQSRNNSRDCISI